MRVDERLDRAPAFWLSFTDDSLVLAVNRTLLDRLGLAREDVVGHHVERLLGVGSRIFYQTHLFPLVRMHGHAAEIFLLLRAGSGEDIGVLCNAVRRERDGRTVTDCVLVEVQERRKYEDALLQARRTAEAASRRLQEVNQQLEEQAVELELQHHQLQEQAAEMEVQADQLAALNMVLEARTEELERQRRAAEDANRAKSQFLSTMSHELRTPLNAIGGYVQLLQMGVHGPLSETQLQTLARVERSQRHLLRLINEVLNLARIEAGRVDYHLEPMPLAEIVAAVLPMVEPQMAAKGLQCTVRVAPELRVRADRDKAQQILLNLLTNAVKFTGAGGRIGVEGQVDVSVPGFVALRVTDSGMGIPPEMQDRVFEPFVQVDTSHTRSSEGTGLGLAISRDLAQGMGGRLTLKSEVGVGSTFTLALPAADTTVGAVAGRGPEVGDARDTVRTAPRSDDDSGPRALGLAR